MPSVEAHLQQAADNVRLFEKLVDDPDCPAAWAVTVLYYAAVHLGRAAGIACGGGPYSSHIGFEGELRGLLKAPDGIVKVYRHLKDEAERARYDCRTFTPDEARKLKNLKFAQFETWARRRVEDAGTK